jgi:surface carbohydrate biosynthesis protein
VAWDEEGLVRYPPAHYYRTRISEPTLDRVDAFFAWGEDDAAVLEAFPGYRGTPIFQTGNPRVDLLRPNFWPVYREAARELERRHGRYILINTNFGFSNHFLGKPTAEIRDPQPGGEAEDPRWLADLAAYRNAMFEHFQRMVPEVARAFPERPVILRPHPSEGHDVWRRAAAGCPNVQVLHEGSVIPWVFGADVVVHNGCTTAVESFLLGRPAVAYKPMLSDDFDRHLPDALSHPAYDVPQLVEQIGRFVGDEPAPSQTPEQNAVLGRHLAAADGKLACDQIVEIVASSEALAKHEEPGLRERLWGWREARLRRLEKRLTGWLPGGKNTAYDRHRFPGVSEDDVNRRIGEFSSLLDRFHGVRARRTSRGIFEISARE